MVFTSFVYNSLLFRSASSAFFRFFAVSGDLALLIFSFSFILQKYMKKDFMSKGKKTNKFVMFKFLPPVVNCVMVD
jgi:hypothetical protein